MSNTGSLKEELIRSLSDDEIARLVQELKKRGFTQKGEGVHFLKTSSGRNLFSFLHYQILGFSCDGGGYARRVIESMNGVRKFISELPPAQVPVVNKEISDMPQNLSISNDVAGTVFVSFHAWCRFIERWHDHLAYKPSDVVAETLQNCFTLAVPDDLKKRYRVERIINNKFKQAEYYLNEEFNFRFVISSESGCKVLLTVEKPH